MEQMLGVSYNLDSLLEWNLTDTLLDNAAGKNKHFNWNCQICPEMQVNEMYALYDKYHRVPSLL